MGYPPGGAKPEDSTSHRNGSGKTVLTDDGPLGIAVPRDRDGAFEPGFIPKHERRFTGFDDKILALYARRMTVREIQGFLARRSTWRSRCCLTAAATSWASGSSKPRARTPSPMA